MLSVTPEAVILPVLLTTIPASFSTRMAPFEVRVPSMVVPAPPVTRFRTDELVLGRA